MKGEISRDTNTCTIHTMRKQLFTLLLLHNEERMHASTYYLPEDPVTGDALPKWIAL